MATRPAPSLSVLVPCRDAASTLPETLEALCLQEWEEPWEVLVVDNASSDGSPAVAEAFARRLRMRLVRADRKPGLSYTLNTGLENARSESIAICDADDVPAAGWVAAMGGALQTYEFVASRHDGLELNPPGPVRVRGEPQSDGLQKLWYPPFSLHAGSCGMGFRRGTVRRCGGFDEGLQACMDTDLCIRLQAAGVSLRFVPEALMHVRYRTSPEGAFRQAMAWSIHNQILYARYGASGARHPRPWAETARHWRRIVRQARRLGRKPETERKYALGWSLGWELGLLVGCVRTGTAPYPYPSRTRHGSGATGTSAVQGRP